jgi:hypothetical protein
MRNMASANDILAPSDKMTSQMPDGKSKHYDCVQWHSVHSRQARTARHLVLGMLGERLPPFYRVFTWLIAALCWGGTCMMPSLFEGAERYEVPARLPLQAPTWRA